jgi:hypothetical protein
MENNPRIKKGDWVRFTGDGSIRNGLIGSIEGVVSAPGSYFVSVFFPLLGQSWNCNVRKLARATEEEIAITIAREALGHQFTGWFPEREPHNVQISSDDLTDGMMRGRGTPLERGRIR